MTANFGIWTRDAIDLASVSASNEDSAAPAANLLLESPRDVWQTTGLSAYLTVTMDRNRTVDLVSLLYTNFTFAATWRIRGAHDIFNYVLHSDNLDNPSFWSTTNVTVSSSSADPTTALDGVSLAQLVTETTATGTHEVSQNVTLPAADGGARTTSSFWWQGTAVPKIRCAVSATAGGVTDSVYADVDFTATPVLVTSAVSSGDFFASLTATVTAAVHGYHRIDLVYDRTDVNVLTHAIKFVAADGSLSYAGSTSRKGYFGAIMCNPYPAYEQYVSSASSAASVAADLTGAPSTDSGTIRAWCSKNLGTWDRPHAVYYNSSTMTEKYWRIDVADDATYNSDGIVRAGVLLIAKGWQPELSSDQPRNIDIGENFGIRDMGTVADLSDGGMAQTVIGRRRTKDITIDFVNATSFRAGANDIDRLNGATRAVLFSTEIDDADGYRQQNTIYGLLKGGKPAVNAELDLWRLSYSIEEKL